MARAGGGYATAVFRHTDGPTRMIFFRMGIPIGADTSEADGVHDFRAGKESDLHIIRLGDGRYEIPEAVLAHWNRPQNRLARLMQVGLRCAARIGRMEGIDLAAGLECPQVSRRMGS